MGGYTVIRDASQSDLDALAAIWFAGWKDAHADILPPRLARHRTLASFRERISSALAEVRVAEWASSVAGFSLLKDDELYQFYVAEEARGSGVATILMADALAGFRMSGVHSAWLACAIGNDRAARFYEKSGWHRVGEMVSQLPTPDGLVPLSVWRYEICIPASQSVHAQIEARSGEE